MWLPDRVRGRGDGMALIPSAVRPMRMRLGYSARNEMVRPQSKWAAGLAAIALDMAMGMNAMADRDA